MRKTIAILLLLVATTAVRAGTQIAQDLVDKIVEINPTDRLIPAGKMEFSREIIGQVDLGPISIVETGTVAFKGDRLLFERHIKSASLPPMPDAVIKDGKSDPKLKTASIMEINGDTVRWITPGFSRGSTLQRGREALGQFSLLTRGVMTSALSGVLVSQAETIASDSVRVQDALGTTYTLTANADGAITEYEIRGLGWTSTYNLGDHKLIQGKLVPTDITWRYEKGDRVLFRHVALVIDATEPSDAELSSAVFDGAQLIDHTKPPSGKVDQSMRPCPAGVKYEIQEHGWCPYCCPELFEQPCCGPGCLGSWIIVRPHCHCEAFLWSDCWYSAEVTTSIWYFCEQSETGQWCPPYHCYTLWDGYAEFEEWVCCMWGGCCDN